MHKYRAVEKNMLTMLLCPVEFSKISITCLACNYTQLQCSTKFAERCKKYYKISFQQITDAMTFVDKAGRTCSLSRTSALHSVEIF